MKKLFLPIIAFIIGTVVNISIQACANDFDEPSRAGSSSNSKYSAWQNDNLSSYIIYDTAGQISSEIKYTYNSKGWVSKSIQKGYVTLSYGQRYKCSESTTTYTYSSSGDTQYQTTVSDTYNENGQKIYTSTSSVERKLR